jgi:beta-glucosidase
MIDDFESESYWREQWTAAGKIGSTDCDFRGNHGSLIRKLGATGSVLFKNVNSTLPLKSPKKIDVFGNAAGDLTTGLYYHATDCEYGCLPDGVRSGSGRFSHLMSLLEAMKIRAHAERATVQYILNNTQLATGTGYLNMI